MKTKMDVIMVIKSFCSFCHSKNEEKRVKFQSVTIKEDKMKEEKKGFAKLKPSALSELRSKAKVQQSSSNKEGLTVEEMGESIVNSRKKTYPNISKNPLNGNSLY